MGYPSRTPRQASNPAVDLRQVVREELEKMLTPYMERLQVLLGERGPKDKSQAAVRKGELDDAVRRLEAAIKKAGAP